MEASSPHGALTSAKQLTPQASADVEPPSWPTRPNQVSRKQSYWNSCQAFLGVSFIGLTCYNSDTRELTEFTAQLPEGLVFQRLLGWHFCHGKLILFNLSFRCGIWTKKSLKTCSEKYILLEQYIFQRPFAFSYQFFVRSSSLLKIHEETVALKLLGAFFWEVRREEKEKEGGSGLLVSTATFSAWQPFFTPPTTLPCNSVSRTKKQQFSCKQSSIDRGSVQFSIQSPVLPFISKLTWGKLHKLPDTKVPGWQNGYSKIYSSRRR